jgi:hypothetical protein
MQEGKDVFKVRNSRQSVAASEIRANPLIDQEGGKKSVRFAIFHLRAN